MEGEQHDRCIVPHSLKISEVNRVERVEGELNCSYVTEVGIFKKNGDYFLIRFSYWTTVFIYIRYRVILVQRNSRDFCQERELVIGMWDETEVWTILEKKSNKNVEIAK